MFKILSANTLASLEALADNYNIESLGSLTISNGHFYLAILGAPKVVTRVKPDEPWEDIKEPEVTLSKPKVKGKPKYSKAAATSTSQTA